MNRISARCTLISFAFCLCVPSIYIWTYNYLNYNDKSEKSDIIILFSGPNQKERLKEAYQLMHEGYASVLVIPNYGKMYVFSKGRIVKTLIPNYHKFSKNTYPRYYEGTHIEVLEAKKIMEKFNFHSEIMVSTPCHMRRIKIISSNSMIKFFLTC